MVARLRDAVYYDTRANQPAAGDVDVGTIYCVSDESGIIERSNGTTWDEVAAPGASGNVATDAIWDAAGDLAQGTGSNTAAKLTLGASGTFVRSNGSANAYAFPPGHEFDYTQFTTGVTVTGTAEGAETTVVASADIAYDGSTVIMIDFFSPDVRFDASALGQAGILVLYEDSTLLGRIGVIIPDEVNNGGYPLRLSYRKTPTASSYIYTVKAYKTNAAATFTVDGTAGGSGLSLPGFIRITKAN